MRTLRNLLVVFAAASFVTACGGDDAKSGEKSKSAAKKSKS